MKKFFLKLLILCLAVCTTLCVFVACGGNADEGEDGHDTPAHTCVFDKEVTTEDYKKSDATCIEKAKYYYSCECGEKGDSTFEYGDFAEHVYDKEVTTEDYKKSDATCTEKAKYYYSCECGEKGDLTFEYGDFAEHVFDKEVTTEDYKESDATCIEKAKYYYSCECGEKGTLTFEYGNFAKHKYVENKCKWCNKQASVGLEYKLINGDTEYEVVGIGTCVDTDIVIPTTYENKPVTSIGSCAFSCCYSLTSIVIPNRVTSIGKYAFVGCSSLTNITVEEENTAYKSIDGNLYSKDGSTLIQYAIGKTDTAFTIPDSVTSIGDAAFHDCDSLASVVIPDSVTSIGEYAFYDCDSLTSVVIPDNVTSIGDEAFYSCDSLTSVVMGKSVTSIGYSAFEYCSSLTSVVIPDSVTSIGYGAFRDCRSLTSVVIPDNVTSIGSCAFLSCDSLTSVVIPDSVTSIGNYAFSSCDSLTIYCEAESQPDGWDSDWNYSDLPVVWNCNNNDVAEDGYIYTVIDGIRYGLKNNVATVLKQPDNITIAEIKTSITHKGNTYIVTSIGEGAFKNCKLLTSIVIPDSVTSIGSDAFSSCRSLTSVVIGDSVTSIGEYAFYDCYSLTSVVIPDSVTSIVECAFFYCQSLTIYCEAESKPSGWSSSWNYSNRPVVWGYKG